MASSFVHFVCLMFLFIFITKVKSDQRVFNVKRFGAVANGRTDNSKVIFFLIFFSFSILYFLLFSNFFFFEQSSHFYFF